MKISAWPAYTSRKVNPYTFLLYKSMSSIYGLEITEFKHKSVLFKKYDILHAHWPDTLFVESNIFQAYFYVFKFIFIVLLSKLRGTKLVWTIHNLQSHENTFPRLRNLFEVWFIKSLDGTIALSKSTTDLVAKRYPELLQKPMAITPHGHYRSVYTNNVSRKEARRRFGMSDKEFVLLFIGQIRSYKNVPHLIQSFCALSDRDVRLIIAGRPASDLLKLEIEEACKGDSRVQSYLDFVNDDDMQMFMNAADMVVLPYSEILNSGSAILALSFNKPILVPEKGSMGELKELVGAEWVFSYSDALSPTVLSKAIYWSLQNKRAAQAPLEQLDWSSIAQQTLQFYQQLLEKKSDQIKLDNITPR